MRFTHRSARVLMFLVMIVFVVSGCASTGDNTATKESADQGEKPKEPAEQREKPKDAEPKAEKPSGLPTMSDIAGYKRWLKMNSEPVQGRTHGLADIYINQERETIAPDGGLVFPFPAGTIIVKEIQASDLVAIMRKTRGADPAHNDWQWIEYGAGDSIAGKDSACWGCHADAKSKDYVFTELEAP